ncbi:glycerate kinase [Microbacterium barkeri]|uniref:glycerate kinase n=1 Tax=Microbacterium barkeri TaxID=33917 RepID=UPI0024AECB85|nr:glycerate kinase [Microbacterium barkeri]MDI6944229.1 glycerate kinase [Microbacterium barkeri]
MRIVIAPDKFKGSLSAEQVAQAVADGLRDELPDAEIDLAPVADGGEGTVDAAVANGFARHGAVASGPLGDPVAATWAQRDDLAVIEMATASGLELVPEAERDALRASSRGTGDLIRAALGRGARRLVLAVGGSASTDGGAGMLAALGARLLDEEGRDVPDGGAALARVRRVDLSGLDPRLVGAEVVLASDVDHPLLGARGAARVFGPQKGASPADVETLDAALAVFADALESASGVAARDLPGAGAAGGVGFGALAALRARRRAGVDVVLDLTRLADRLRGANLVVTGEGSLDEQSLGGKTPLGVARTAAAAGVPAVAVCGRSLLGEERWREAGFAACYATTDRAVDAAASIRDAAIHLRAIGRDIAAQHLAAVPRN